MLAREISRIMITLDRHFTYQRKQKYRFINKKDRYNYRYLIIYGLENFLICRNFINNFIQRISVIHSIFLRPLRGLTIGTDPNSKLDGSTLAQDHQRYLMRASSFLE